MSMSHIPCPEHDHIFGQDQVRPGERRVHIVIALTIVTTLLEIAAGLAYRSMALLADGLHMGTHVAALLIAALAYVFARHHAHDRRFSFGTGKINALGGFSSALILAVVAVPMIAESVHRLISPQDISFDYALMVAVFSLSVNGASALILGGGHHHDGNGGQGHHHDHNLRGAYFHVLADAVTSFLAIFALLAGKFLGWLWVDASMGIVGALIILRWSWGLARTTGAVLLDRQAGSEIEQSLRRAVEEGGEARITDLHVWAVGPGIYAAEIALISKQGLTPDHYKARIPSSLPIVHVLVEVHQRQA